MTRKGFQRVGEESTLTRRHQEARLLVDDRFRDPGDRRQNNWSSRSHRLQDDGRENIAGSVVVCRGCERENVADAQSLQDAVLRQRTGKCDVVAQPQFPNVLLQFLAQWTVADDLTVKLDAALGQLMDSLSQI